MIPDLDPADTCLLVRNRPIRPSKLGLLGDCPWQFLLSTEQSAVSRLPQGPMAILGSAMHQVIEVHAGHKGLAGLEVRRLVQENFGRRAMAMQGGLLRWVYAYYGINGVLPPSTVMAAAQLAFKNVGYSSATASSAAAGGFSGTNACGQLGRERKFASEDLDMEGRPDLVYRKGEALHVVDFKLGLGRDATGKPNRGYILQIAAYGLIVKQAYGAGKVVLELRGPGDEWVQVLDAPLEAAVHEAAKQAKMLLPRGKAFSASSLVRLGNHCQACSYRPGCLAYLRCLESSDEAMTDAMSPFDVSGTVASAMRSGESWRVIVEALPDGRRVVVDGIVEALAPIGLAQGAHFQGYALGTNEIKGRGNYIANLHWWSLASPRNSAFTALIALRPSSESHT